MSNFEEDLKKLESLASEIKQSDIPLEVALKDFEEGIKLAKRMEKELDAIEGKIQVLMNSPDPDAESPDAPPAEESETKPRKSRSKKASDEGPVLELFNGSTEVNGTRNA